MIHVLNYLPKRWYDIEKAACEKALENGTLTITELREELRRRFESDVKDILSDGKERVETALFSKQFKGRCQKCGNWGHKSVDCKDNKNGDNKSSGGNSGGGARTSKKCTH